MMTCGVCGQRIHLELVDYFGGDPVLLWAHDERQRYGGHEAEAEADHGRNGS